MQPSACVMLTEMGNVVHWFSLEVVFLTSAKMILMVNGGRKELDGVLSQETMVEPSDIVVVHQKHFISDFRDHCVCVFNNWGHLMTRLGGWTDGIVRYPRGLGLIHNGLLCVSDTDMNRFHISVWNTDNLELVSYHGLKDIKVCP